MAIVRMKKIRLLAVQSQKEQLLRELMLFGCVEISEPDFDVNENSLLTRVTPSEAPERFKQKMDKLTDAVKLMDQYAPAKKGLLSAKPEVQWNRLENDAKVEECQRKAGELLFIDERLKGALNEEQNCLGTIETLRPWEIMEMPLETTQTRSCSVLTGTVSAKQELGEVRDAFNAADLAVELQCVSADEDAQYILCIFLKSEADAVMSVLRNYGFSAITFGGLKGTARDNIRRLEEQVEALQPRKQAFVEEIAAYAADREDFQCCIDYLGTKMERAQASYKLLGTDSTVYLQGWLSAPDEDELRNILEKYDCAWELIEPEESEYPDVPVKLKNNWFTRPLNMVTEMYSLPAYDGLDPNPLMAPFFILFYGIMMADMGYGLVMLLLGWLIKKKMRPAAGTTMNHMGGLMLECGVTTFIFGAITGGFFGDFIPQIVRMCGGPVFELPYLFTPLNDTLSILIGSLALGVVQTITGMAVSVVKKCKDGEVLSAIFDEVAWWLILAGVALLALGIGNVSGIPVVLCIGAAAFVVGQFVLKKSIIGGLVGIFSGVYNGVTGIFSDILSYSRLMALMLSGSIIASVFNTLGSILGNVILFILVSMFGNILNFGLNLLGCFVHDLRLQCLEFFGRFYKDGGRKFEPLTIKTKYVNVLKEEQ